MLQRSEPRLARRALWPGDAAGLLESGREFVDRSRDSAGLFRESGHHPFGNRWFVPD